MASTPGAEAIPPPAQHPATTQASMEQDNTHHDPPDKQGTRWAGRDDCGLPEHPDLSCAGAAEFIRARTHWDLPRTHGPMLPGAVQTANGAPSRVEQTKRFAILPVSWEPRGDQVTPTIKTQSARPSGQIRPTSSSPCTPEPARRRKPAELTPVAMPVLKSP